MPYFKIETNKKLDVTTDFLNKISEFTSTMLGKPEKKIMISVCSETKMMLDKSTAPVCYIQLKSVGLPSEKCGQYSKSICEFIEAEIGVRPNRIYINFSNIEKSMFGCNKKTL